MTVYRADLHVHTVLSPCAEVEMIPPLIVQRAEEAGLDMVAVTDHNSAENVAAVVEAADHSSLKIIPGIECESLEGVHLVCLFDEIEQALSMQDLIYDALPDLPNRAETFGAQFVVDSSGEFVRYNDRLLLVPTEMTIEQICESASCSDGVVIAAHVDRPSYGIYGVLGFIPESPRFDAVEISRHLSLEEAIARHPDLACRAVLQSSDAHRLAELGSCPVELDLPHRTVRDLREALRLMCRDDGH